MHEREVFPWECGDAGVWGRCCLEKSLTFPSQPDPTILRPIMHGTEMQEEVTVDLLVLSVTDHTFPTSASSSWHFLVKYAGSHRAAALLLSKLSSGPPKAERKMVENFTANCTLTVEPWSRGRGQTE